MENQCHGTWDTVFEEDDRPWIKNEPQGTLVVMLLRRVAGKHWFKLVVRRLGAGLKHTGMTM